MSNRLHLAKVGPQDGVCLVLFDFVWFCDSVWFYVILFDCLVMSDFVWFSVILFVSVWFSVTLFGYAGVFFFRISDLFFSCASRFVSVICPFFLKSPFIVSLRA